MVNPALASSLACEGLPSSASASLRGAAEACVLLADVVLVAAGRGEGPAGASTISELVGTVVSHGVPLPEVDAGLEQGTLGVAKPLGRTCAELAFEMLPATDVVLHRAASDSYCNRLRASSCSMGGRLGPASVPVPAVATTAPGLLQSSPPALLKNLGMGSLLVDQVPLAISAPALATGRVRSCGVRDVARVGPVEEMREIPACRSPRESRRTLPLSEPNESPRALARCSATSGRSPAVIAAVLELVDVAEALELLRAGVMGCNSPC